MFQRHAPIAILVILAFWLASPPIPSSHADSLDAPVSFRFDAAARPRVAPRTVAPFGLTASDGTGLSLVALEADGVLEGPLAFTELRMTFQNPRPETIEGRFRITLPPGAVLSRFAMKIGDAWQEGEVVERQRARRIYEDFLHRRQDPALLEQQAGNEFTARVFPIPGHGVKELVVSYSHALESSREPYVIPLLGLPEIGRLDLRVLLGSRPIVDTAPSNLGGTVSERRVVELHETGWTPTRDFEVEQGAGAAGLRHGNLVAVRFAPPVDAAPQEIDGGLYVLVDSSASRALGYAEQIRLVAELVEALVHGAGPATPVGVAAFDQAVTPIYEGTAESFGNRQIQALEEHRALGASDVEGALRWLAGRLGDGGFRRVLMVTDGVATAGEVEGGGLGAAASALGPAGVERLDALAVGGLRDEAALRRLVTGHLEHDGAVLDGAMPRHEIARRLTRAVASGIEVAVEGARWTWPAVLDGVQPGDEALVYADLPAGRPLRVALAGQPLALAAPLAATERPLLERAWARARIDRLLHLRETDFAGDADVRRAMAAEVTRLSVEHRVLSPFTAFLVLETEHDYRRHGLDRRALGDILTVGPGGLEVARRAPPAASPAVGNLAVEPSRPLADSAAEPEPLVAENHDVLEGSARREIPRPRARRVPIPDPTPDEPQVNHRIAPGNAHIEAMREEASRLEAELRELERKGSAFPRGKERRRPSVADRFAEVRQLLRAGLAADARERAEAWSAEAPGDVLALLALGEACEATGDPRRAARAYGSLIDLFPARADLRRHAGERLENLGEDGLALAVDTYAKAREQRPDHPSSHRLLAWALFRAERFEEAFAVLEGDLRRKYPPGRFAGAERILREDLGLVAAAWLRHEPARRAEVLARLRAVRVGLETEPSLRFVLTWETDANDVDLHVRDGRGGHAYYRDRTLPSGGELYADVTNGYGPECFTVRGPASRRAGPYRLEARYYRRGPMGFGPGTVQIVEHDGRGGITIEGRPFVVTTSGAFVDLGTVK